MKKLATALLALTLSGCGVVQTVADNASSVPKTFIDGVLDAAKWLGQLLFDMFMSWWVSIF